MKISSWLSLVFLLSLITGHVASQSLFRTPIYPRSIVSLGMGEQGAALTNTADAMQYNPANLVFTERGSFSHFRKPATEYNGGRYSFTSDALSLKFPGGMCAALEYTRQEYGSIELLYFNGTIDNMSVLRTYHPSEQTVAAAFAMPVGSDWAAGLQMRYLWASQMLDDETFGHLAFSGGVSYRPEALAERATIGLSLMNFGTADELQSIAFNGAVPSAPMPARLNLASTWAVVRDDHFDATVALGFTKPLENTDAGTYASQSSFRSLLNDWDDFPEDVTTSIGLGYVWKPLALGGGYSFFQEMYLGYFTAGASPKSPMPVSIHQDPALSYRSYFTHGVRVGIGRKGVTFSAAYAGRWHQNSKGADRVVNLLWRETFQFDVNIDWNPLAGPGEQTRGERLNGILLSGGYAYCAQVGRMKGNDFYGINDAFSGTSRWEVESDFYLSENSVLVASLGYARLKESIRTPYPSRLNLDERIETVGLASGYRYHPIEQFHPMFVEASLGIMWLNPLDHLLRAPYGYKTFSRLAVGCAIPAGESGLTVMPKAGLTTLFMESLFAPSTRLCGYNQFELGLNIGYRI